MATTQTPVVLAQPQGTVAAPPVTTPGGTAPAATSSGGDWGWLLNLLGGIGSAAYAKPDMSLAQQIAGQATQGTNTALDRLTSFLNDPNAVTKMPGYEFGMNQGMEAVNRGAGASGLLNSGNRLLSLQNFGQAYAGNWMDRMWNELIGNVNANVAGGGLTLGAGQFLENARQQQKTDIGGALTGILTGLPGAISAGSSLWNTIARLIGGGGGGGGGGDGGNLPILYQPQPDMPLIPTGPDPFIPMDPWQPPDIGGGGFGDVSGGWDILNPIAGP